MANIQFFIIAILIGLTVSQQPPAEILYEWTHMNVTWPSYEIYKKALDNGDYIVENNPIAGIKVWKDRLYLTIPRWKHGVPATLISTSIKPVDGNKSPNVEPFPNWEMQKIGDCSAFQFVQSMEIDPKGRMWIIDTGRVATLADKPLNLCPPRLVIINLENNGEILLNYKFPADVASRKNAYLNDIVLEHEDGGWAYITDTSNDEPGIVVFSLRDKKSWKVTHKSMWATAPKFTVKYDNTKVSQPLNVDGIGISASSREGHRILYYSPLSSLEIFSVSTAILKKNIDIDPYVKREGRKLSQTDGMIVSADDKLYFGLLADNSVSTWNTEKLPFEEFQKREYEDHVTLQWPDTFAIDVDGNLWCVSNRLQTFLIDKVNVDEMNYRVVILKNLQYRSYQYYEDGSVPKLPVIA